MFQCRNTAVAVVVTMVALAPWAKPASAQTFTSLLESTDVLPGSSSTFDLTDSWVALDGDNFVVRAAGSGGELGVYKSIAGVLSTVVEVGDVVDSVTIDDIWFRVGMDDGDVVLAANSLPFSARQVLLTDISGTTSVLAHSADPAPGGNYFTSSFQSAGINDGVISFAALTTDTSGSEAHTGGGTFQRNTGGTLVKTNDVGLTVPAGPDGGTPGSFTFIRDYEIQNGVSMLYGTDTGSEVDTAFASILVGTPGSYTSVVDTNTLVPGGVGTFKRFVGSSFAANFIGGAVVLQGMDQADTIGLYTNMTGSLEAIATTSTPVPGEAFTFESLSPGGVAEGYAVFWGTWDGGTEEGFFRYGGGIITPIVLTVVVIGGRTVSNRGGAH